LRIVSSLLPGRIVLSYLSSFYQKHTGAFGAHQDVNACRRLSLIVVTDDLKELTDFEMLPY
jgi:hypothetical protein